MALPRLLLHGGVRTRHEGVEGMTIRNRAVRYVPEPEESLDSMLLSDVQAAERLGVSVSYLRKSRCEGLRKNRTPAPPFVRVGGRCYYRLTDLRSWVDALEPRQVV